MSGSGERWTRERQFSRDLEDSMRLSRDSTPDRDLPRNKTKRIKINNDKEAQILQFHDRISEVLICTVCLANPSVEVYQCHYGHLMCIGCFYRLLADARIKDEQARCPKCRVDISRSSCARNLAVEQTLSELLTDCVYCNCTMARGKLGIHSKECKSRPVTCLFSMVGCAWTGPVHQQHSHLEDCEYQGKPCREVIGQFSKHEKRHDEQIEKYRKVTNFMSQPKMLITDVTLNPHRTDDFLPQLYYETSKFNLFGQYWLVRGRIQGDEHNYQRTLSLKIFQKGKNPIEIEYCFLRDPYSTVQTVPEVHRHCFTNDDGETDYHELRLVNPLEVNNLLAEKSIKLRLYMSQVN